MTFRMVMLVGWQARMYIPNSKCSYHFAKDGLIILHSDAFKNTKGVSAYAYIMMCVLSYNMHTNIANPI